jgi:secreted PhoX family phosphatase
MEAGLSMSDDIQPHDQGVQHLFGATESAVTYPIARNDLNDSEFTGVVFPPDGATLYANIQEPGIMPAITGPWRRSPRR